MHVYWQLTIPGWCLDERGRWWGWCAGWRSRSTPRARSCRQTPASNQTSSYENCFIGAYAELRNYFLNRNNVTLSANTGFYLFGGTPYRSIKGGASLESIEKHQTQNHMSLYGTVLLSNQAPAALLREGSRKKLFFSGPTTKALAASLKQINTSLSGLFIKLLTSSFAYYCTFKKSCQFLNIYTPYTNGQAFVGIR